MKTIRPAAIYLMLVLLSPVVCSNPALSQTLQENSERTCFQTGDLWQPRLDIHSDVSIVYGVNPSFVERLNSWRDRGYGVQMMTGSAWGEYQDYFEGRFDGKKHMDEGQTDRDGNIIWHGPSVPYVVPSENYLTYMKSLIKTAIDNGVTAVHLEEPEFWARAGYSEGFRREWQAYYGEPWQPQHESPDATYRSQKLKYHLYFRALNEMFAYAKEYSTSKGRPVACYVPTHSLINYSSWQIVSPEASLADLPNLDGYIGQVWTGTARTPVFYEGVEKERTFENAFLEYGSIEAMTRPTGKRVYFLTDPIEDDPDHSWEDYRINYEATFTAQLMYPSVSHYEVMPWPGRIFLRKYKEEGTGDKQSIPPEYATEILVLINALNDMHQQAGPVSGLQGVGVLLSNTMMFQSFPSHAGYSDSLFSNFYGMALPLLKHGIPVQIVQMEHLGRKEALEQCRVLVMSYANMKPLSPDVHRAIAEWVRAGGALVYAGRDRDPFQSVREWWNQGANQHAVASEHLFELLGIGRVPAEGIYPAGKGVVAVLREDPKEFVMEKGKGSRLRGTVSTVLQRVGGADAWKEQNFFWLKRGPYDVAAVLDESVSDTPLTISGPVIDLFDARLPVYAAKTLRPGERSLLLNCARLQGQGPAVLAAASRVTGEQGDAHSYRCVLSGPAATRGVARIFLPAKPGVPKVFQAGKEIQATSDWDAASKTLLVRYPNDPDGTTITVSF